MTQRDEEIEDKQLYLSRNSEPKRGDVYLHYKGGLYVVLGQALKEDDLTDMVIYQNLATGHLWCRPFSQWHDEVKGGSRFKLQEHKIKL